MEQARIKMELKEDERIKLEQVRTDILKVGKDERKEFNKLGETVS